MDWTKSLDDYCERTGAGYWAEPVNAVTNIAFVLAAAIMWPRVRELPMARALCVVLFGIGIGSYLFHTHATRWAEVADVLPIQAFILLYLFLVGRDFLSVRPLWAAAIAIGFFPYAAVLVPVFARIPGFALSAGYAPVPVLILIFAALLRKRAPATAREMALGAAILVVSLVFRTFDMPLCDVVPVGTHFVWHLLNATMLGWMIEVYRRHMLAGGAAGR